MILCFKNYLKKTLERKRKKNKTKYKAYLIVKKSISFYIINKLSTPIIIIMINDKFLTTP